MAHACIDYIPLTYFNKGSCFFLLAASLSCIPREKKAYKLPTNSSEDSKKAQVRELNRGCCQAR